MSDERFCQNHKDRLFKYLKIKVEKCTIQECQRQIPEIERLCQKCLQKRFEEVNEQKNLDSFNNSIEELKKAVKASQVECDTILEQQRNIRLQLIGQLIKIQEQALTQLDNLFDDLMKYRLNVIKFDQMLNMIGQENTQNQSQYDFYQLTYNNLEIFLKSLENKQPHELNQDAIKFGHLIDNYLHSQDKSIKNFQYMIKNDIQKIGKFNVDVFSENEKIRTFFGSLQYNQIISSEDDGSIKNIFIPIRNQVVLNDPQQDRPVNEQLQIIEEKRIFTYTNINQYQNNKKNREFIVEVKAENGISIKYEKLKYEDNILKSSQASNSCQIIVDGRKGEFDGSINPLTLELNDGKLTFRNLKNNQTHLYDGKFNYKGFFFRGTKKIIDQNNKEICYQGYFDYKLQQQGKGCYWIHHDNKNILRYLGGFHDGKLDSQGKIKSLCRQKYNNNTIFIGQLDKGQQQQENGKIFYLKEKELLKKLDEFEGVGFDQIDSQDEFKLIKDILGANDNQRSEIKVTQDPTCKIF